MNKIDILKKALEDINKNPNKTEEELKRYVSDEAMTVLCEFSQKVAPELFIELLHSGSGVTSEKVYESASELASTFLVYGFILKGYTDRLDLENSLLGE